MRVLICGPYLSEEMEIKMPEASPASGKYLRNLIGGLETNGAEVITLSYITIPVERRLVEDEKRKHSNRHRYIIKDKTVLSSLLKFRKEFKYVARNCQLVIFYNVSYVMWGLCEYLNHKGIKSLLILADHTDSSEYRSFARKVITRINEKEFKVFGNVIILSPNVKSMLNPDAKIIRMEGGIRIRDYDKCLPLRKKDQFVLMYSGLLSRVTGVDMLLQAISINQNRNISFIITGKGELELEVLTAAKTDSRIQYLGYVSNDEFYNLLNRADAFVNPRNMSMLQNQNNFPSKVLEYLATGRIVLSTEFAGYEHFKENFIFYDGRPEKLNELIENAYVLEEKERHLIYYQNRKLAMQYDWDEQSKKILQE